MKSARSHTWRYGDLLTTLHYCFLGHGKVLGMKKFKTRQIFDLSGEWDIIFGDEIENIASSSVHGSWPISQQKGIQVPGIWNLEYPNKEGIGYYRKTFLLPERLLNKSVRLCFGGVTYHASVWLNGAFVGSHEGGYTPFSFDATPFLRVDEENQLVVRVIGLSKKRNVGGFELLKVPASKQTWYYVYAGLWGNVYLESIPAINITSFFITPDLANKDFLVEITVENKTCEIVPIELCLNVFQTDDKEVTSLQERYDLSPGRFAYKYNFELASPIPWNLENPHLYQAILSLGNEYDDYKDVVIERFGMRDFTVREGEFFLNGKPIFLKVTLNQPNYPKTLIVPPTQGMIEKEIRLIKDAGFNMARMHIRPAPPGYLELADEIGLLIYAESPLAWIKESPRLVDHGKRELREMILRDQNHPSVVIWGILNENRHCNAIIRDEMFRYVRSLDPTRVVIDNSGGTMAIDQDFGWIDEAHILPNRDSTPQKVRDLHLYIGSILPERVYDWLRNLKKGVNSRPLLDSGMGFLPIIEKFDQCMVDFDGKVFVSEIGCGGFTDLDRTVDGFGDQKQLLDAWELEKIRNDLHEGFALRKLERVFGSIQNLVQVCCRQQVMANRSQIEAIIQNPDISGFGLTQLNDVAWEFQAGILDLWRNPKPVYYELCRLNKDTVAILHPKKFITTHDKPISIEACVIHRLEPAEGVLVSISIITPDGQELLQTSQYIKMNSGVNLLEEIQFYPKEMVGSFSFNMTVYEKKELMAETEIEILVLPDHLPNARKARINWVGRIPEQPSTLAITGDGTLVAADPGSVPEKHLQEVISSVEIDGVTLIFGPLSPKDEFIINFFKEKGINLILKLAIGNWMGCHHWMPQTLINEPLVTNPIADEKFIGIIPRYSMLELGGEILAGSFQNAKSHREPMGMVWFSDIEKVPLGKGYVVFCQYPIFDSLRDHPLAIRILDGILLHSTQ
jgi:beta-galactosidase